jgi:hypothetical protein
VKAQRWWRKAARVDIVPGFLEPQNVAGLGK